MLCIAQQGRQLQGKSFRLSSFRVFFSLRRIQASTDASLLSQRRQAETALARRSLSELSEESRPLRPISGRSHLMSSNTDMADALKDDAHVDVYMCRDMTSNGSSEKERKCMYSQVTVLFWSSVKSCPPSGTGTGQGLISSNSPHAWLLTGLLTSVTNGTVELELGTLCLCFTLLRLRQK